MTPLNSEIRPFWGHAPGNFFKLDSRPHEWPERLAHVCAHGKRRRVSKKRPSTFSDPTEDCGDLCR